MGRTVVGTDSPDWRHWNRHLDRLRLVGDALMDGLVAVLVIAGFYFAFRRIGYWKWVWLTVAALIGGWEVFALLTTGKTISQQYYFWADGSPWWWAPALLVALGGIGLAVHLVWKRIRRRVP